MGERIEKKRKEKKIRRKIHETIRENMTAYRLQKKDKQNTVWETDPKMLIRKPFFIISLSKRAPSNFQGNV